MKCVSIRGKEVSIIARKISIYHCAVCYCCKCGHKMSGYRNKPKNIFYYQCRNSCSTIIRNSVVIHQRFIALLGTTKLTESEQARLGKELQNFQILDDIANRSLSSYKNNTSRLANQIEQLEKRYATGEISNALYLKHVSRMNEELAAIKLQADKIKAGLISSIEKRAHVKSILTDIPVSWQRGDLKLKQIIHNTLFPKGIIYTRTNDQLTHL